MPAALFIVPALRLWELLLSRPVRDEADSPPWEVPLSLVNSLAALESDSCHDAACAAPVTSRAPVRMLIRNCFFIMIYSTRSVLGQKWVQYIPLLFRCSLEIS